MPNYEELLKHSLAGATVVDTTASSDLHEQVAAVSDALAKVTGLSIRLELVRTAESAKGTTFRLSLVVDKKANEIGLTFFVPRTGYPLSVGLASPGGELASPKSIPDKDALAAYFAELSSNTDSPLVLRALFLLRKHVRNDIP